MNLALAFRLSNPKAIAFVGAGGKTTAMFQLARELAPVLVSASTHLGDWQVALADRHIIWPADAPIPEIEAGSGTGVTLFTGTLAGDRYTGLSPQQLEALRELAAARNLPLLIEADGARRKPLKAPAEHEPPIPPFVDIVVVVAGLSALDLPLTDENVHRPELFAHLAQLQPGAPLTTEALAQVLAHPQGGLKNIPAAARRIALLNQADTPALQARAGQIANRLLPAYQAVVVASLLHEEIWAVHEPVAAIILAAGQAARFGKPKQLLDYHGQSFIRKVAYTALEAGLSLVVVVSGAHAQAVEEQVSDLPLAISHNADWQQGQSSSIKAGLTALPHPVGAAIFLLADQPQVTPHVIRALVERHATARASITAPLAADRRANPVLFDTETFADLLQITGDVGGRAIFSKYQVDYITWHDESLLLDVDTEDDYRKLLAWGVED